MTRRIKMFVFCTFLFPSFSLFAGNNVDLIGKEHYHRPAHYYGGGSCSNKFRRVRDMVRDIRLNCQNAWNEARCFRKALGDIEREIDHLIYNY